MRAARQEKVEAMRPVCIYTAGDRIEAEMLLEATFRDSGRPEAPAERWMCIQEIPFTERRSM